MAESSGGVGALDGRVLHGDQLVQPAAVEAAVGDEGELVAHSCHPAAQGVGGAHGRCRGVVEFVGEARGQGAERNQSLAFGEDGVGGAGAEEEAFEQMEGHGEPRADGLGELVRGQDEQLDIGDGSQCVGVGLVHPVPEIGLRGAGVDAALVRAADFDVVAVKAAQDGHRAAEQYEEAGRGLAFGVHRRSALPGLDPAALGEPVQLRAVEGFEEEQRRAARRG